jgi:hypothetical protein
MNRVSMVVAAMLVAMAGAVTVVMVGDGTPAARFEEDLEWRVRLAEAEAALAAGQTQVMMVRLRDAHRAALRTGRWEAMVEVGDVARRAGAVVAPPPRVLGTASRAYLAGLARAREQDSLDGVLRVADGFAALDDREMVEHCIGVAGKLAERAGGDQAVVRVLTFTERYREARSAAREGLIE